jgi:hypothetical protein
VVLPLLENVVERGNGEWVALCPAHNDHLPSLSIKQLDDGVLLMHCFAGCETEQVVQKLGLTMRDLYPRGGVTPTRWRQGQGRCRLAAPAWAPSLGMEQAVAEHLAFLARSGVEMAQRERALPELAGLLGLPVWALEEAGVGLAFESRQPVWTFPEKDGQGNVVGLMYRGQLGQKWGARGGRRGLSYPNCFPEVPPGQPVFLPEGHSDTIALHAAGCIAVGRPASVLSGDALAWLVELINSRPELKDRPLVVVGDNDRSGRAGAVRTAQALQQGLGRTVEMAYPPEGYKDVREWYISGGLTHGWPCAGNTSLEGQP